MGDTQNQFDGCAPPFGALVPSDSSRFRHQLVASFGGHGPPATGTLRYLRLPRREVPSFAGISPLTRHLFRPESEGSSLVCQVFATQRHPNRYESRTDSADSRPLSAILGEKSPRLPASRHQALLPGPSRSELLPHSLRLSHCFRSPVRVSCCSVGEIEAPLCGPGRSEDS